MISIAPSILSADFGKLAEEISSVEQAGADLIHIDVMDGHFVPNLTFGPLIIRKCKEITSLPLDVHLMISNAEETVDSYIDAGADLISVHVEAVLHLQQLLAHIKDCGVKAGVALNPATPVETISKIVKSIDFVLVMSVNPGFEGQNFIDTSIEKIAAVRELLSSQESSAEIEVDGGVGIENSADLVTAGATMLVAGSAIFKSNDPAATIRLMKSATQKARKQ